MKLKKLFKVLAYRQPIRIVGVNGMYVKHDNVQYYDEYYKLSNPLIAECQVLNVRHVHDDLQLPDYQDFIEIKIMGGN